MKHKLDLIDNAIDSLREALSKYEEGTSKGPSAYKFAVLHFSHFFELLFKYYVAQSHPLLIYKNPFSKRIEKENTIGLWDALQFLKNEGLNTTLEFDKDLEWIKKLRNNIEHFKFELDAVEVRNTLGRLIRATNELNGDLGLIDIEANLGGSHLKLYQELGSEYKSNLATARASARADSDDGEGHLCGMCGEMDVAAINGTSLVCKFCKENSELVECCNCQAQYRENEVRVWNDDHPPQVDCICDYCYDRIMGHD